MDKPIEVLYGPEHTLTYSNALEALKNGEKVARTGWNGKGMWLFLLSGHDWNFVTHFEELHDLETLPFICMKTADNKLVPWLASQTDQLAEDWVVLGASTPF